MTGFLLSPILDGTPRSFFPPGHSFFFSSYRRTPKPKPVFSTHDRDVIQIYRVSKIEPNTHSHQKWFPQGQPVLPMQNVAPKLEDHPPRKKWLFYHQRKTPCSFFRRRSIPDFFKEVRSPLFFFQGLVNVPFWEYWTSPYSSHKKDHIPIMESNGWVM